MSGGKNGTLQVSEGPGNGRPKQWEDPWAFYFLRLKALYSVSSNKETHSDSKDEHWQLQTEAEMEMRHS